MLRYEKVSKVNSMNNLIIENHTIQNKIFTIRDVQVMLDSEEEILRSKISTSNLKTFDEKSVCRERTNDI
jgi:hypothetical protein